MRPDELRLLGDPVLRTRTEPVTTFGDALHQLVPRMFAAMVAADGIGLAANQIGVGLRVFVYDLRDGRRGHVVNPTLVVAPDTSVSEEDEGCLSVPGQHHPTPRATSARVHGVDLDGRTVQVEGVGLLARCLQHEVDHLDGVIYLDRIDPRRRREALEQLRASPGQPERPPSPFG